MREIVCRDGEIALVDKDQYEELAKLNWYLNAGYPCHCIKRIPYKMHYYVLGIDRDPDLHTHHKNENKLDNRRENLIQVTKKVHAKIHKEKVAYFIINPYIFEHDPKKRKELRLARKNKESVTGY